MVDSPRRPTRRPRATRPPARRPPAAPFRGGAATGRHLSFPGGSQGTFALGGRRFKASLQGARRLRPGDQLLVEGGGEGKPCRCGSCSGRRARASSRSPSTGSGEALRGGIKVSLCESESLPEHLFRPRLRGWLSLRALSSQLPALSLNALSANSLRAALEESGIFFEGKLKAGQAPASDQRGALLKLRGEIQEALAQRRQGSTALPQGQPPRTGVAHDQSTQVQASAAQRLGSELQSPQLSPAPRQEGRRRVGEAPGKAEGKGTSRELPLGELEHALEEDTVKLQRLERQIDQGLARLRLFQHHSLSQPPDQPSWL